VKQLGINHTLISKNKYSAAHSASLAQQVVLGNGSYFLVLSDFLDVSGVSVEVSSQGVELSSGNGLYVVE